ncbi:D-alanyl-D-alanine carboxypeptidase [Candidatus Scalindua japonica]|uniref:D-alanyl-D-alanine carboxypeptidase n=1 Tax=Candidatus Scalindua japonica TaxID=1284222 RepID=A0A286U3T2_9BACT|nr:D-alanyl-D-alanine carboxypeptidase [Candidatus Scalindua japonica]
MEVESRLKFTVRAKQYQDRQLSFRVANILFMSEKSSTNFEKHTKYCTFVIFKHNIYSRKDILLQELQYGVNVLRFNRF